VVASGAVRQDTVGSEPMASTTRMAFARRVAARAENRAASEGSPLGEREARGERPWIKSVSRCL